MLDYLYGGHIGSEALGGYGVELLQLADKYQLMALKRYMEHYLSTTANTENAIRLVRLADAHNAPVLFEVGGGVHRVGCHLLIRSVGLGVRQADPLQSKCRLPERRMVHPEGGEPQPDHQVV